MHIWPSPAFENIAHPFVLFSGLRVPEPPSVHAAPEEWQVSAAAPDVARESVRSAGLPLRLGVRTTQTLLLQRLHLRLPWVRPAATRSAVAPGSSKELQKWHGCMGACVLHISPHLETLFFSLQLILEYFSCIPSWICFSLHPTHWTTSILRILFFAQCWTGWCSLSLGGWVVTAGC